MFIQQSDFLDKSFAENLYFLFVSDYVGNSPLSQARNPCYLS